MHDRHEHDLGLAHDLKCSRGAGCFSSPASRAPPLWWRACAGTSTNQSTTATSTAAQLPPRQAADAASCATAAPAETAGPYPGDGSNGPNVLIESGVVRDDIRASFGPYTGRAEGVPMLIELSLKDLTMDCAVGAGMAVYVWHCDRDGNYSLYEQGRGRAELPARSAGRRRAGAACSSPPPSRPVTTAGGRISTSRSSTLSNPQSPAITPGLTSQIALPEDTCKAVYAADKGYRRACRTCRRSR